MKNNIKIKIFITGGTGLIGKHLIDELNVSNYNLFVLTRNSSLKNFDNINYITGDIFQISKYTNIISNCDYFIHIAGEKRDVSKMYEVNVDGMRYVLEEVTKYPTVKVLYISSCGIYGIYKQKTNIIYETTTAILNNEYEKTKYEAEKILELFAEIKPLNYVILRPSNVFSELDKENKLLNLFRSLKKGKFFYISKKTKANYVYVKYLTAVIHYFIKKDKFENKIYNINSPCLLVEFIETIKQKLNIEKKTLLIPNILGFLLRIIALCFDILPYKYQVINSIKYRELVNKKIYSIEKIKSIVNIDEKMMLSIGLENLIKNYQKQGLL